MPTKTINVAPEVFLDHQGVTVYHVYHGDDVDMGRVHGCFSVRSADDFDDFDEFDIAKFDGVPSYAALHVLVTTQRRYMSSGDRKKWVKHLKHAQAAVLKEAIELGLIQPPAKAGAKAVEEPAAASLCERLTALDEEGHSPLDETMVNDLAELVSYLPSITALAKAVRQLESHGILTMDSDATPRDRAKQAARKAVADLQGIA